MIVRQICSHNILAGRGPMLSHEQKRVLNFYYLVICKMETDNVIFYYLLLVYMYYNGISTPDE